MFNNYLLTPFRLVSDSISKITTAIIILLIVGVFIYFFIKSNKFRGFCGYLLVFVLLIGGIFSGYHLNKYYSIEGGIVGQLSDISYPNSVNVNDENEDIVFDFSNVMMTQIDGDKYRAEFVTDDFIELAVNEGYVVYVNNTPCELIEYGENYDSEEISSDYVISEYYYAFYDEDKEFVLKDKLTFRFAFYKNSTRLIVETNGGESAVSLWNSYFQKNDFIVSIKAEKNVYFSSLVEINLKIENEIVDTLKIKKGSVYILPDTYTRDGYRFMGWSFDGETITTEIQLIVLEDIDIYAIFEKLYYVRYCYINEDHIDQNSNIYSIQGYIEGETLSVSAPTNPTRYHYEFLGWSLDGETIIDLSALIFDGSIINIYGVWQANGIELHINLDGGSMILDDITYNNSFSICFSTDEKIVLSEPIKEGYVFSSYVISHPTLDYYFVTSDKTLNLTTEEIFYKLYGSDLDIPVIDGSTDDRDFELTSLVIKAQYNPTEDNIEYWSDDDLKQYIEFYLGFNYGSDGYVYNSVDNETWIRNFYWTLTFLEPESMTLFEVESFIIETLEINSQITEETTTREFIEILYWYTKDYVDSRS